MTKCFVKRNFRNSVHFSKCWRGTCLSCEMLKGYIFICRNAEGVHGKKKVGTPALRNSECAAKLILSNV